jgi:hypothetical protein
VATLCASSGLVQLLLQALGLPAGGEVTASRATCCLCAALLLDLAQSSAAAPFRAALAPALPALVGMLVRHPLGEEALDAGEAAAAAAAAGAPLPPLRDVACAALAALPLAAWKMSEQSLASHWTARELVLVSPAPGRWVLELHARPPPGSHGLRGPSSPRGSRSPLGPLSPGSSPLPEPPHGLFLPAMTRPRAATPRRSIQPSNLCIIWL